MESIVLYFLTFINSNNSTDMEYNWRDAISIRTSCQDAQEEQEQEQQVATNATTTNGTRTTTAFPPINRLPILASDYFENNQNISFGWTPKLKTLLEGVSDNTSPFHNLAGFEDSILRKIYSYISYEYVSNVKLTLPAKNTGRLYNSQLCRFETRQGEYNNYNEADDLSMDELDFVSFAICGTIRQFPTPKDRNVNMMPFVLGKKESLPEYLQCYYDCIQQCPIEKEEKGNVCYLTVHESFVHSQTSQRRQGLHIETPGLACSSSSSTASFLPGTEHHWGGGHFYSPDVYKGGIYFASNVSNTSVVYNALVDKNVPGIVDKHGNCEHLRQVIGPGTNLEAGQLVWMTDRTPHEAISQEEDGYRQFFRVVTSNVSHWFEQHSTPNPNVKLPDHVIVVSENKFQ
jgi:hypothetical protein